MIWRGDASGQRLAKCLITLYDQVDARWPNRRKDSDGSIGDARHQATVSDHNPGPDGVVEAIDITHDPAGGFDCHKFAETLRIARDPRLEYMIWNRQIMYSGGSKPWQWQGYSGDNPHTVHIHISCSPDSAVYDIDAPWVIERAIATRPGLNTNIIATVFGGPADTMSGAETVYGTPAGWWDRLGVSLPARFAERPLPTVRLYFNGKTIDAPVIDVGPWNINDAYWRTGARPQAESGFDMGWTPKGVRPTNRAGIDLTPATAGALGLNGKGVLDWEFIANTQPEEPPVSDPAQNPATLTMDQKSAIQLALVIAPMLPPPANTVLPMLLGSASTVAPALPPPVVSPPATPPSQPQHPPAAPPVQPSTIASVLASPGTKLGTILGIATAALQIFGILPPGLGESATQAGQGISFLAGASPIAGAMGLFQWLGRLFNGGK